MDGSEFFQIFLPTHTDFLFAHACYQLFAQLVAARQFVEKVCINESLRELSVQMAYYVCGRMRYEDVRRFYAAAGLYDIGRDEAASIKTHTLQSNHMSGKACDFVPCKDGKIWWGAPEPVWERMGEIGEANGLKWGGRWKDFKDSPHFEA